MKISKKLGLFVCIISTTLLFGCSEEKKKANQVQPNILFCIADDATFMHLGAYGCDWVQTPAFDKVAQQGILFNNAYTPNAKCAPSRSCIITGRNSWQLEEAGNHWSYFPTKFKSFSEALADNGYYTGYTAKGIAPVVALKADGKRRALLGKAFNSKILVPPTTGISKIDYAENFKIFLNERPENQPFCFWYGGIEPHRGYEFGSGIKLGNKSLDDIKEVFSFWPNKDSVKTDMLDYAFEIEHFDSHLGKMINSLEEQGILENTIIVVTADNGMPFPRVKGQAYEYSNHLPLAIMWKAGIKNPGRTIDDLISFIDFTPTFLEVAGIAQEESGMQTIQGKSLVDIFNSSASGKISDSRDFVLIGKERHDVGRPEDQGYPIRGIRTGDYLFVKNFETDRWPSGNPETGYLNCDGGATKSLILNDRRNAGSTKFWDLSFGKRTEKELYNIVKDPDCVTNLMENPEFKTLAAELETKLTEQLKSQQDPRMFGNGEVFDNYIYANKNDVDFYGRYKRGEEVRAGWVNTTDFEPPAEMEEILKNDL